MTEISNETLRKTLVKMADTLHLPKTDDGGNETHSVECLDLDELRESLRLAERLLAEAESDRSDVELARQWLAARIEGLRKARALLRDASDDGLESDAKSSRTMAGLIHRLTEMTASLRCLTAHESPLHSARLTPGMRERYRAFKS